MPMRLVASMLTGATKPTCDAVYRWLMSDRMPHSPALPLAPPNTTKTDRSNQPELGTHPRQRAWVEVSGQAITANVRALRRSMDPGCQLMAVVKADGYGHGAVPVARAAAAGGASCFGVATLGEGLELRQAGFHEPVLVLGNLVQAEELRNCLQAQLMPTLSTLREALLCQNLANGSGRPMAVHLKVDTGMTRLGADWQEGPRLAQAISNLDSIQLAGIYSHLAHADAPLDKNLNQQGNQDEDLSRLQLQRYESVLAEVQNQGLAVGCRHLANSAGTLRSPSLHFDLVRVGLALYGHRPAAHLGNDINFLRSPAFRPGGVASPGLTGPLPWRRDGNGFRDEVLALARTLDKQCELDIGLSAGVDIKAVVVSAGRDIIFHVYRTTKKLNAIVRAVVRLNIV